MKELTDAEKLEIAVNLLDKAGLEQYEMDCYSEEIEEGRCQKD